MNEYVRLEEVTKIIEEQIRKRNCLEMGGTDRTVLNVLQVVKTRIWKLDIVEAEPVRHGRWIVQKVDDIRTKFYCSECERCVWCGNDYFMKPSEYVVHVYPYCHCGAKMRCDDETE